MQERTYKMNKFNIGNVIYTKVKKRASDGSMYCHIGEKLAVDAVAKRGNSFLYVCGPGGYIFKEDEIMSSIEYAEKILIEE